MPKSLRSRLALLLVLANLPAAAMAVGAATKTHEATTAEREREIVQRAELIATRAGLTLGIAEGVADTLAVHPEVASSGPSCARTLQAALSQRPEYAGIIVSDAAGRPVCTAGDTAISEGLRSSLVRAIESTGDTGDTVFLPELIGRDDTAVLASRPFTAPDGSRRAVGLLIRRPAFDAIFHSKRDLGKAALALVRDGGKVVSEIDRGVGAEDWEPAVALPVGLPGDPASGSTFETRAGQSFHYAIAPVRGTLSSVVLATPMAAISTVDWPRVVTAMAAPLLMMVFGILAIFVGVDRLVLRWISRFRNVSAAYARGDYTPRIENLDRAPSELAELGTSFNIMAERIQERSRALEEAIEGKNDLLRELHHRVKNNFQMIASLLALQRRELPNRLRTLLRVPEDRVLAMAAAYKASYATGEIGRVSLVDLLRDVAGQLRQSFGLAAPIIQLSSEGEPVWLDLDRAVPLGLLVSEIMTAALDRADFVTRPIEIRIKRAGMDEVHVELVSKNLADAVPVMALAGRLVAAYRSQLGASLESPTEDSVLITMAIEADLQLHPGRVELGG